MCQSPIPQEERMVNSTTRKIMPRLTAKMVILFLVLVSIGNSRNREHPSMIPAFQIAADSKVYFKDRIKAALTLTEENRSKLRIKLMSELPGKWDKSAVEAIEILGEIGDDSTLKLLENIDLISNNAHGKICVCIEDAIEKIKARR
jgi:hypothetical protein